MLLGGAMAAGLTGGRVGAGEPGSRAIHPAAHVLVQAHQKLPLGSVVNVASVAAWDPVESQDDASARPAWLTSAPVEGQPYLILADDAEEGEVVRAAVSGAALVRLATPGGVVGSRASPVDGETGWMGSSEDGPAAVLWAEEDPEDIEERWATVLLGHPVAGEASTLTVKEEDDTPTVEDVTSISFDGAAVEDLGGGAVRVTIEATLPDTVEDPITFEGDVTHEGDIYIDASSISIVSNSTLSLGDSITLTINGPGGFVIDNDFFIDVEEDFPFRIAADKVLEVEGPGAFKIVAPVRMPMGALVLANGGQALGITSLTQPVMRITGPTAAWSITSITGSPYDGDTWRIINASGYTGTLTGSSFELPGGYDYVIPDDYSFSIRYDGASAKWRIDDPRGAVGNSPVANGTDGSVLRVNAGILGEYAFDTDGTLAANSDTVIASQKAVKTYVDTVAGSPSISSISGLARKYFTGTASTTSNSLQDATDTNSNTLSFSIGANEAWLIDCQLCIAAAPPAAGSKAGINCTSTLNDIKLNVFGNTTSATAFSQVPVIANNTASGTALCVNVPGFIRIFGVVENGASAGTLTIRFCSNTNGQTTTLARGSHLIATRVS
jgi:hypothetical protein